MMDCFRKKSEKAKEALRKWNKNNIEKVRRQKKLWREANPAKYKAGIFRSNLKKYGLTVSEFNKLVALQKGKCLICGKHQDDLIKQNSRLVVDHDHKTGKVRGLLCSKCNRGIGMFREKIDLLLNAVNYLKRL